MTKQALSAKAMRKAAPPDTLPYEVVRKHGEPYLYKTLGDVRRALLGDIGELEDMASRIGTADDRAAIDQLRQRVMTEITDDAVFPLVVSGVIDSYTGVVYHASVTDRRI